MLRGVLTALAIAASAPLANAQPPERSPHRITVVGCIKRSQPDVVGTTGTTALSEGQTRYVLVNVAPAADTSQSATSQAVEETVSSYRLDDAKDPAIAPHVGQKVEITGTVRTTAARSDRVDPNAPKDANAPILTAEKVQEIVGSSHSCEP